MAYEMIVDGFAKGDKAALKNLLSKEVYEVSRVRSMSGRRKAKGWNPDSWGLTRPPSSPLLLGGKKATIPWLL